MIELREWQKKAMNEIKNARNGAIVVAATGTGKTILGIKLLEENSIGRFLIVVPTIVLQKQWKKELLKFGVATEDEINLIGGGNTPAPSRRISIAVVNSLRNINWDHPLAKFDYLILDEVHRYASEQNVKFLKRHENFGFKLGLTATLRRSDGMEVLLTSVIGPVVYSINKEKSIDEGYVCDYEVKLIPCQASAREQSEYNDVDTIVKDNLNIFNNNFNEAQKTLKSGPRNRSFPYAVKVMRGIQQRKSIITNIQSKVDKAIELCMRHKDNKIILFDELQSSADKIHKKLGELGIDSVVYHSGLKNKKQKLEAVSKFTSGEVNILVSVRALDEGMDVKDADVGIVVNGNSQERQILQRLGRILRKGEDKTALLYMLYVPGTIDQKYIRKRMRYLKPIKWDEEEIESVSYY